MPVATQEPAVPANGPQIDSEPVPAAPVVETPSTYGCDAALAYLRAYAHPAFRLVCPGYAFGGQAVTCINVEGYCPNDAVIIIAEPCEIAYRNEAANSWTLYTQSGAAIDPYGPSC